MYDDTPQPERPHAAPDPSPAGDPGLADLLSGVEAQLARLRELEGTHRERTQDVAGTGTRLSDLEAREMALHARELELDERSQALRGQAERVALDRESTETNRERIASLERELAEARARLDVAASDGLELTREAEAERDTVISELETLRATSEEARSELDAAHRELHALRGRLDDARTSCAPSDAARTELTELHAQRATLEASLAEHGAALQAARRELTQARTALETAEMSRADLAARLELAELAAAGDEEERRIETLSREVDDLRAEILRARERAQAAERAQAETEAERAALEAELTDARAVTEAEGESLEGNAAGSAMQMRVKAMQQRINKLEAQLVEATAERGPAAIEKAQRREQRQVQMLERRIADLERELAEAREAAGDEDEMTARLRRKAEHIAEIATHLKRRQVRLRRARMYLERRKDRAPVSADARQMQADAKRKIESIRQALDERRHTLAAQERRMVRRWARAKAIVIVGWVFVLTLLAGGLSWGVTSKFFPAVVSASANLDAKWRKRAPIPDEEARTWQDWHAELLRDQRFLGVVAQRLDERRVEPYGDVETLAARLDEDLTIDRGEPSRLTLTLAGRDPDELTTVLDILASCVATESTRLLDRRPGEVWAVTRGERLDNGEIGASEINPVPVRDDRLMFAAPMFAGTLFVVFLVVGLVYRHLARVKREFDEDDSLFDESLAAA